MRIYVGGISYTTNSDGLRALFAGMGTLLAKKMSNAETAALERATAACKGEAKGRKFTWHWLKRRKYVQNCII